MSNIFDQLDLLQPYHRIRAWTGRLLSLTGSTVNTFPNLNIGSGLDLVPSDVSQSHTLSVRAKHQVFTATANQAFTGSVHKPVRMSTSLYSGDFHLTDYWDFTLQKFTFPEQHKNYLIRLDGIIPTEGVTQNPIFHIDFEVSGNISTVEDLGISDHISETINRQTVEVDIRTGGAQAPDHHHFHAVFVVHVDEDLFASGAQLYAATSGETISFNSGTMQITEIG